MKRIVFYSWHSITGKYFGDLGACFQMVAPVDDILDTFHATAFAGRRHEGVCRLLAVGVDIRIIQLMLGHSDIKNDATDI